MPRQGRELARYVMDFEERRRLSRPEAQDFNQLHRRIRAKFNELREGDLILVDKRTSSRLNYRLSSTDRRGRLRQLMDLTDRSTYVLYTVTFLSRTGFGDIVDLMQLSYNPLRREIDRGPSYQLYGNEVRHDVDPRPGCRMHALKVDDFSDWHIQLKPHAQAIREAVFARLCPGGCVYGWLNSIRDLPSRVQRMMAPNTVNYAIVCPYCLGEPLTMRQYNLRVSLMRRDPLQSDAIVNFMRVLNAAHRFNNYEPYNFSARDWFDNLQDVSNSTPPQGGAHPAVIAALPRDRFRTSMEFQMGDEPDCKLCLEPLTPETIVFRLSCGCLVCDRGRDGNGCMRRWFRLRNYCPGCRAQQSYGRPRSS